MPLDDLYTMVLEISNTVTFNYFFSSVEDTEQHIQEKMIESMFSNITRIIGTSKTQQLYIPYNASISGFLFWFRNEHNQPSNLSVQFVKSSFLDFSSQFLTGLFNYILITLLGNIKEELILTSNNINFVSILFPRRILSLHLLFLGDILHS